MCIAERVNNPLRNSSNFAGDMNVGDERFNQSGPRRFYSTAEYPRFVERYGHLFSAEELEQIKALTPATGLGAETNLREGVHFIWVNTLNPTNDEGTPIAGQVIESTIQNNSGQKPKIYPLEVNGKPSTSPFAGRNITSNGKKIFTTNKIEYCIKDAAGKWVKPASTFLPVDAQTVPEGLSVEEARRISTGTQKLETANVIPDDEGSGAMNLRKK